MAISSYDTKPPGVGEPWHDRTLRLLARAGRILGASLDVRQTLVDLGHLVVPEVADVVVVQLVDPETGTPIDEFAHAGPDEVAALERYLGRWAPADRPGSVLADVVRTGKPVALSGLPPAELRARLGDDEQYRAVVELGFRETYAVPVLARDRILGAMSFMMTRSGRSFGEPERLLLEEVAARAALAIDTARLVASQHATERAVAERERELQLVIDSVPVLISYIVPDHRYAFTNRSYERWFGMETAEVTGRHMREVLGDAAYAAVRPYLERGLAGEVVTYERQLPYRTGPREVRVTYVPDRGDDGAVRGVVALIEEITERKRWEERIAGLNADLQRRIAELEGLFEVIPVGIAIARDPECREVTVNEACRRLLRIPPDRSPSVTAPEPVRPPIRLERDGRPLAPEDAPLQVVARTGRPLAGIELDVVLDDGSRVNLLCTAVPVRGADGRVEGAVGAFVDITERRRQVDQRHQAGKMEALGRLAGGLAHDFNNQLQALTGFVEFAARDPAIGEPALKDLHDAQRAVHRMASLTQQLLAYTRQQVLAPETLDLAAVVSDTESLLRRLLGSNVEIRVETAEPPIWVRADRAQLTQVLLNLVVNARDAMPRGGTVAVRTRARTVGPEEAAAPGAEPLVPGPYAELTVTDTGEGIAPEDLPRIFEPFFTTKEVGRGTGLGLATVQGVVTQSRGRVSVTSEPGRGAQFTVLLPLAPPPVRAPAPPAPPVAARASARVLVVEDEEAVRRFIARVLQDEGCEVAEAASGRDALTCLDAGPPVDLVLSDVIMPGSGGVELAEALARRYPELPVVWMSGFSRDTAFAEGRVREDQPFLQKPLTAATLAATVRSVLTRAPGPRPT